MIKDTYLEYLKRSQKFRILRTEREEILNSIKENEKEERKDKKLIKVIKKRKVKKCSLCDNPATLFGRRFCEEHERIFELNRDRLKESKIEIIQNSRKRKEENYLEFKAGNKICKRCNYTQKVNKRSSLYSKCCNCRCSHWLVGNNYPCEICERICITPIIHHVDGNRKNNDYSNLLFICLDCHTAIHRGVGNIGSRTKKNRTKIRMYKKNPEVIPIIQEYTQKYRQGIKKREVKA